MKLFSFLQPNPEKKSLKRYQSTVDEINTFTQTMKGLSDADLKQRVVQHKGKDIATLKQHIPEIFAATREAGDRTLKMRHFDVQLMGGLALLDSKIAEMKTGEGKTLVATLPLILHGLTGNGAHLVTVNEYLARRDAEWMRPLYEFFDLRVGVIIPGKSPQEKREAYHADITYATNNELGFDYLRDNMAGAKEDLVQRDLSFAIIDEVDSILIDEARTPLIISAPDAESTRLYEQFAGLVPNLSENTHYNVDEKRKAVTLTDDGMSKIEELLGIENIYHEKGIRFVHHLEQALRAHVLFKRDRDYIVQNNEVIIVDEFTGRLMQGRRYSDGLHQAIEAKEQVKVQQESRTLATITFQNFFRLYAHLSGMTGTALTSAEEFEKVYNLEVAVIPTNKAMVRNDKTDRIFFNEKMKFAALVEEIKARYQKKQPVLVGTIAIEKSEYLSSLLTRAGVPHQVLNAKQHAKEAEIIAKAGQAGAITISTNMAGRGTDIKLGDGVQNLGGLFVLGTERHEARRIDNQLRGRSGRQGDPGETQFFVSLDDDVMRIFGGQQMRSIMQRLRIPEDQPIENRLISRALEGAQERVEGYYFDMRKQVLSYDDVLNRQRNAIYSLRRSLLINGTWKDWKKEPIPIEEKIDLILENNTKQLLEIHASGNHSEDWNLEEIAETIHALIGTDVTRIHESLRSVASATNSEGTDAIRNKLEETILELLSAALEQRERQLGEQTFVGLEKAAALRAIDVHWMEHLDTMDYLRTGIGLRSYGQRDPLVEYQREGHRLFGNLLTAIDDTMIEIVFKARAAVQAETVQGVAQHESALEPHSIVENVQEAKEAATTPLKKQVQTTDKKSDIYATVGRNDLCPCGSGKKFKKCHGQQ